MSFCRKLKTFLFSIYHFHDYTFLFSGPWGFYLSPWQTTQVLRPRNSYEKLARKTPFVCHAFSHEFFLVRETCSELVTALFRPSFSCEFLVRVSWTENLGRLSWALGHFKHFLCMCVCRWSAPYRVGLSKACWFTWPIAVRLRPTGRPP